MITSRENLSIILKIVIPSLLFQVFDIHLLDLIYKKKIVEKIFHFLSVITYDSPILRDFGKLNILDVWVVWDIIWHKAAD